MLRCLLPCCSWRPPAAQGATKKRTVTSELTPPRRRPARSRHRARRAPGDLPRRQAHRQAPPARQHPSQRTRRCGGHGGGHRRPPRADRAAPRAALAHAGAQPRLLVGQRERAEHPPHLLPRLPARLAVVPGPGPAVPPARQLRQAQPALGQPLGRHGPAARRAARAARPARRRRRVGVLLRLRRAASRRGSRASRRARASSRSPASPQRTGPRGRGAADRRAGARRVPDARRRRACAWRPATAPSTRSTRSRPGCA